MVAFLSPTFCALVAGMEVWGSPSPLSAITKPILFLPDAFPSFETYTAQIFSPLPIHMAVIHHPFVPLPLNPGSLFLSLLRLPCSSPWGLQRPY
ncbi:hypothetical protein FKM82_028843 [Ascaphus truei]